MMPQVKVITVYIHSHCSTAVQNCLRCRYSLSCVLPIGISGAIQMDFNSDRISDFMVYYLSHKTGKYEQYMELPLTKAASNITDCLPWMVYDTVSIITLFFSCFSGQVFHVSLGYCQLIAICYC